MKLPNGDRAVVDIAKLRDYCLSADHPRGRHKARVFASATGLTTEHAEKSDRDEFGRRYTIDLTVGGPTGSASVRSSWIVRTDEDFPRLTSCHVL